VLVRSPRTLAAPRAGKVGFRPRCPRRGADSPPAPRRGVVGKDRLAAALRPSRSFRLLLASKDSALRRRVGQWNHRRCTPTTTASADFSRPFPRCCHGGSRFVRQRERPPRLSLVSFPRASPDLPSAHPDEHRASVSIATLPHAAGLVSGSCSSSPSFGISSLQIPPRDGHPGLASRFRSPRPAEDLHLQETKHAWQTKRPPHAGRPQMISCYR
jgi:hypothetical protein